MRWAYRVDQGSPALVKAARDLGFVYEHTGGKFDGLLWLPAVWRFCVVVDWKRDAKARKTKTQKKAVAVGFPVLFVHEVATLEQLRRCVTAEDVAMLMETLR